MQYTIPVNYITVHLYKLEIQNNKKVLYNEQHILIVSSVLSKWMTKFCYLFYFINRIIQIMHKVHDKNPN